MRTLVNPRWLLLINTLPVAILLFIFWRQYEVIHTLLEPQSIQLWKVFGFTLAILGLVHLAYALWLIKQGKTLPAFYGIVTLLLYAPFVYSYGHNINELMPWNLPRWMVSQNILLYVGTFLMPTMAHAVFVMAIRCTSEEKNHKAWVNFIFALAVPAAGYVFSQVILPLWKPVDYRFFEHVLIILTITGTIVFLFFLIRGIYIISFTKAQAWRKYQLLWKIPIALILPLVGLAINNGLLLPELQFYSARPGIFGIFTNPWFYALAVLNGILVCLPDLPNKTYRLALFLARSLTFAYTLYFFLVLLPYLPLSVIAIIAFGAGFLMLTPLLLFILHVNVLYQDVKYLRPAYSTPVLLLGGLFSFLILPMCLTGSYLQDKKVLSQALAYVYTPDFSNQPKIHTTSLRHVLSYISLQKDRRAFFLSDGQTPYLSSYYNWLVLDNMTLSDQKINQLERVFFGQASFNMNAQETVTINSNKWVKITGTKVHSEYLDSQQAWQSTLELELTNFNTDGWNQEYETAFELPTGCWINDYYLWIEGRKEQGLLAEKKAATWIYNQITSENRDPGILYYLAGNNVAFKVFPFRAKEKRTTAISFLHKEPTTLSIDSVPIHLGNNKYAPLQQEVSSKDGNVVYIPATVKQRLPKVYRTPYYHFIIDGSIGRERVVSSYIERINNFLKIDTAQRGAPQFTFASTYVNNLSGKWQDQLLKQPFTGGFFLERAIQQILAAAYEKPTASFPIIVVVTDNLENAVLEKGFADLQAAFPEEPHYYTLSHNGQLTQHSLLVHPKWATQDSTRHVPHVLAYPNQQRPVAYLPDNKQPSIIMKNQPVALSADNTGWQQALAMQGCWMQQTLHPHKGKEQWLSLVKASFQSKVMMPVTSYIAVENEAQKVMLKRKQEEVLSGNKSLDADEEVQRMSEPGLWLLLVLVVIGCLIKYRKQAYALAKRA